MAESASISRSIVSTSAVVTKPTAIVSIESAIASTRRESAEERKPAVRFKANTGTANSASSTSIWCGSVWVPVHQTSIV